MSGSPFGTVYLPATDHLPDPIAGGVVAHLPTADDSGFLIILNPLKILCLSEALRAAKGVGCRPSAILRPITTIVQSIAPDLRVVECDIGTS